MELVINEGHLVASPHPSWSPFGRECSSPAPGMGMQGTPLRPDSHPMLSRGSRNSRPGEAASEQAPDSGTASCPQLGATCDTAMLPQGEDRQAVGRAGRPFLKSGCRGSEAHSARPPSLSALGRKGSEVSWEGPPA